MAHWAKAYKVDRGCVDCGFDRWPESLQFDHVDPATKRKDLGWQPHYTSCTTWAQAARYQAHVEAHCVVRCGNCHAHRTMVEQHHRRSIEPTATPTLF